MIFPESCSGIGFI